MTGFVRPTPATGRGSRVPAGRREASVGAGGGRGGRGRLAGAPACGPMSPWGRRASGVGSSARPSPPRRRRAACAAGDRAQAHARDTSCSPRRSPGNAMVAAWTRRGGSYLRSASSPRPTEMFTTSARLAATAWPSPTAASGRPTSASATGRGIGNAPDPRTSDRDEALIDERLGQATAADEGRAGHRSMSSVPGNGVVRSNTTAPIPIRPARCRPRPGPGPPGRPSAPAEGQGGPPRSPRPSPQEEDGAAHRSRQRSRTIETRRDEDRQTVGDVHPTAGDESHKSART